VVRRLYFKYVRRGGVVSGWQHGKVELNWPLVSRLIELAYRCNLCRRCAQTCPIGADNGLVARELRKLFSQEMGIAAKEIHESGSLLQLKVGSSTAMSRPAVKDSVEFIDQEMTEKTGITVETPWDVAGADVLLIHNAGEILAWPENPGAFALILNAAGISWTVCAGRSQARRSGKEATREEDSPWRVRSRAQVAVGRGGPGPDRRPQHPA
jgi:Fe-S oxidoreductase